MKLVSNNYTYADNDLYVLVLCAPAKGAIPGVTLIWGCSRDWMRNHQLLVTDDNQPPLTGFSVFAEDNAHDSYGHKDIGPIRAEKWRRAMTANGITRSSYPSAV